MFPEQCCKLQTMIGYDSEWQAMKMEDVGNEQVCKFFGIYISAAMYQMAFFGEMIYNKPDYITSIGAW